MTEIVIGSDEVLSIKLSALDGSPLNVNQPQNLAITFTESTGKKLLVARLNNSAAEEEAIAVVDGPQGEITINLKSAITSGLPNNTVVYAQVTVFSANGQFAGSTQKTIYPKEAVFKLVDNLNQSV